MRWALAALALAGCATAADAPVDPSFANHDVRTSIVLAKADELNVVALMDQPRWDGGFTMDSAYRLKLDVRRVLAGPDPARGSRKIEIRTVAHALKFSGKSWSFLITTNRAGDVVSSSPWSWPDKVCFWPTSVEGTEVEEFFTDKTGEKWCGASG